MIEMSEKNKAITKRTDNNSREEATKYVNSNVPLLAEGHLKLRLIALKQGRTLRNLLTEIIGEYLSKNKEENLL